MDNNPLNYDHDEKFQRQPADNVAIVHQDTWTTIGMPS